MEWALSILVFIGVIAVTAVIFCIWMVVTIVRLILRGIGAVVAPGRLPPMPSATRGLVCPNDRCRAVSPAAAKFCRRCGKELPQAQRVSVRRAAMW